MALTGMVVVLALAAGVAATFLVAYLLPTFSNAKLLGEMTGRKVLGSVSMVMSADASRRARVEKLRFVSVFGSLLIAAGVWIAWTSMQVRG